ncbi:MAG: hypothetical protein AABW46_03470, partial [Nanoarchaeota archaeon]
MVKKKIRKKRKSSNKISKEKKEINNLEKEASELNKKLTQGILPAIGAAFKKPVKSLLEKASGTVFSRNVSKLTGNGKKKKKILAKIYKTGKEFTKESKILASRVTIKAPEVKKPDIKNRFVFQSFSITRTIITLIVLGVLFFNLYYFGVFKGSCDSKVCFDEALASCRPVKFDRVVDNNFYEYNVFRSLGAGCKLRVSVDKVAPGSAPDIRDLLESKSMECVIPKAILERQAYDDIENVLDYCSGELKEGVLQLIIKRMYSLVITDLDEIVKEA